jgi:hypothetical protein
MQAPLIITATSTTLETLEDLLEALLFAEPEFSNLLQRPILSAIHTASDLSKPNETCLDITAFGKIELFLVHLFTDKDLQRFPELFQLVQNALESIANPTRRNHPKIDLSEFNTTCNYTSRCILSGEKIYSTSWISNSPNSRPVLNWWHLPSDIRFGCYRFNPSPFHQLYSYHGNIFYYPDLFYGFTPVTEDVTNGSDYYDKVHKLGMLEPDFYQRGSLTLVHEMPTTRYFVFRDYVDTLKLLKSINWNLSEYRQICLSGHYSNIWATLEFDTGHNQKVTMSVLMLLHP